MLHSDKVKNLQQTFFNRITNCCNPSTVKLRFIKTISTGSHTDFTGDSIREVDKDVILKCFYSRSISDKQREKLGVSQQVTDVVYVSPIELERKYGSNKFPDYIRNSYSNIMVEFLGGSYEIINIKDLEPMLNGKEWLCIAYMLNLKKVSNNINTL